MKILQFSILAYFLIILSNCSSKPISNNDIDKFILKYDDTTFNEIRNTYISLRSRDMHQVIYLIGRPPNLPVYGVTFDLLRNKVTNINKSLLEKSNVADYLTPSEIVTAIKVIRRHKFYLLTVDSLENVYINPFRANEPAYFLRLKTFTGDSTTRKGYDYELYKKNWYLNSSRKQF